jgi:hypothetical protein
MWSWSSRRHYSEPCTWPGYMKDACYSRPALPDQHLKHRQQHPKQQQQHQTDNVSDAYPQMRLQPSAPVTNATIARRSIHRITNVQVVWCFCSNWKEEDATTEAVSPEDLGISLQAMIGIDTTLRLQVIINASNLTEGPA